MLGGTKLQKRWLSARTTTNSPQKQFTSSARLSSAQVDLLLYTSDPETPMSSADGGNPLELKRRNSIDQPQNLLKIVTVGAG